MKRENPIPPSICLFEGNKYVLDEDLPPFHTKDSVRSKIREIKAEFDCKFVRCLKHQNRYFIYRKHGVNPISEK